MIMKLSIEVEVEPCSTISSAVRDAIVMAGENNCKVTFQFNSATVEVTGRSVQSEVEQKYFDDMAAVPRRGSAQPGVA